MRKGNEAIKNRKKYILKFFTYIIEFILFIIMIYSGYKIIKWYIDVNTNANLLKNINKNIQVYTEKNNDNDNDKVSIKYDVAFDKLINQNNDIIGWLKVEGTSIEFPVVKCNNNEYYLSHNINKEYNVAGWIFADYTNKFDGTDKNIVIYGHNMIDGTMFSSLKNVLKKNWCDNLENRGITFVTLSEYSIYEVFSVYEVKAEEYYLKTNFKNGEFLDFVYNIKNRSIYDFEIDESKFTENSQIITLSTCANNLKYRIVLHAIKY